MELDVLTCIKGNQLLHTLRPLHKMKLSDHK